MRAFLQLHIIPDHTLDRNVAERSMLIKNMLDDFGTEGTPSEAIPIPNVRTFLVPFSPKLHAVAYSSR